jgi:exosortase
MGFRCLGSLRTPRGRSPESPCQSARRLLFQKAKFKRQNYEKSLVLTLMLVALAGWLFWPVLFEMGERWMVDPQYSHCAIVPLVALFVLWTKRHSMPSPSRPAVRGLAVVAAGLGLNYFGESAFFGFVQAIGFLVVLLGIVATMYGWRTFAWAIPSVLLLAFAIPLPFRVHTYFAEPLQRIVAHGTTLLLQLRGRPAVAMGNVVAVDDHRASVVDACCGLGMLFVVVFVAAAIAAMSRRPLIDKVLLFLAAPLAGIVANILRVAATIEARSMGYSPEIATKVHDVGGYLLGPAALLMLLTILAAVSMIFPVAKPADEPLQIAFQLGIADQEHQVVARKRPVHPTSPRQ